MTVGGVPVTPFFVGIPYGLVGVTQINFTVPSNAPLGLQPVTVTVGGVASKAAALNVTAVSSTAPVDPASRALLPPPIAPLLAIDQVTDAPQRPEQPREH